MNTKLSQDPNVIVLSYGRDVERKPTRSTIKKIAEMINQFHDQLSLQTLTDLYDNFRDAMEGTRPKPTDFDQVIYDQTLVRIQKLMREKAEG